MRLPCHGECHIPEGYLERERERINTEQMRTDFIERIQHRNKVMGFGHDVERATRMFEEQILDAGMTFDEAIQVLVQMHSKTMEMQRRGRQA